MKKCIHGKGLTGIAAFLALAMTACVFTAPEEPASNEQFLMPTENGQTMVKLYIGVGNGIGGNAKALTDHIAQVAANRYEVVFYDGENDTVYRTSWAEGQLGTLWVCTGVDYGGDGNGAILFAGYSNGYSNATLLAVGVLAAVNGENTTLITENSRTVTFSLTPLNNDVYGIDGNDDPTPAYSTFQLVSHNGDEAIPDLEPDDWDEGSYGAWEDSAEFADILAEWDDCLTSHMTFFRTATVDGFTYPVYEMPKDAVFEAAYAIDFSGQTAGIVIAEKPTVILRLIEVDGYERTMDVTGGFVGMDVDGDPLGAGPFPLTLNTGKDDGLIKVCFQIPVNAWSTAPGWDVLTEDNTVPPGKWFIQGGISNTALDKGKDYSSAGGAILLGIGEYRQ